MRKLPVRILCAAVAFSLGVCSNTRKIQDPSLPPVTTQTPSMNSAPIAKDDLRLFWQSLSDESIYYNGYLIERRDKSIPFDNTIQEKQAYVVLSKNGNVIQTFDGLAYHPQGNSVGFGLFSFLGTNAQQMAISQDVPREGVQWIVDLTPTARVIFDGRAWRVGREGADCEVEDTDGDGVFEISLPITDFYELMDKMAMSGIPLPMITFKYDRLKRKYFPANHSLPAHGSHPVEEPDKTNELFFRSAVVKNMLELVYQGKRDQAWQYFNSTYNLDDKKEIERRVKAILRNQPVYNYIYKNQ